MLLHSDILAPKEENCVGKHNFGRHMDQCAWEYRRIWFKCVTFLCQVFVFAIKSRDAAIPWNLLRHLCLNLLSLLYMMNLYLSSIIVH